MTVQELKSAFESAYGKAADAVYFSPGRVNLIGEHTDYNGGSVFPCALSFGTYLLLAKNDKKVLNFKSLNQPELISLGFDQLTTRLEKSWANYPCINDENKANNKTRCRNIQLQNFRYCSRNCEDCTCSGKTNICFNGLIFHY